MFGFLSGLSAKTAVVLALALTTTGSCTPHPPRDDEKWVTIWGSMPQLCEPHNLPAAPFVSPPLHALGNPVPARGLTWRPLERKRPCIRRLHAPPDRIGDTRKRHPPPADQQRLRRV